VFIPDACSNGERQKCHVHLALHGCGMEYNSKPEKIKYGDLIYGDNFIL
jgi:hypothetical protein